ncbi:MAG TPA: AMP-binding protein, partial [Candidatus Aminicenantes bacterium]|nr:AMP-binding protein [Candidatus Aminicenantes bacterium]
MTPLHIQFMARAKQAPAKVAIVDRTLDIRLTYHKALIASLILAGKIRKYHDGFIGVMVPTSSGAMLITLGILMAGKVPVMINYSTGAAHNAEYAQHKCGFSTIITSRSLLDKIGCREVDGMVFIEDIMSGISMADKLTAAVKASLPLPMLKHSVHVGDPDDNVVILFTSGSEKDPKAVQLTHRNLVANLDDIFRIFQVQTSDIMLASLPLFHVLGYNTNFWLPLTRGMTAVTYANPLEYRKVVSIIREEKVTMVVGTPSFFSGYIRQSGPGDFVTVHIAIAGADKTPDPLRRQFQEKHDLELLEGYGPTETSPVISANTPEDNKPGSVGRPLPSVQVRIVDLDTGESLPPGREGKIMVKGDLVMRGYFDDIEETMLRIKDGWYDTGDMGMMDEEGYLWHRGRLRRFVKIGGEMVSLVAVENVLVRLLPEDVDCCVVEVPDSLKGAKIVAVVSQEVHPRKM